MNHNCRCGGRILSLDWRWDPNFECCGRKGFSVASDTQLAEPTVAHFQCNKCGQKYNQRKRQSKKKL